MKNSNRRFFKDKLNIFENLSQHQVQQLCVSEITFTDLTGLLFISKSSCTDTQQKITRNQLYNSMKETLLLSQN